jgi:hypothetical protein
LSDFFIINIKKAPEYIRQSKSLMFFISTEKIKNLKNKKRIFNLHCSF